MQFGGLTRNYLEYVPSIYNGSTPVPVVLCLHGLGDNMTNFFGIGMNHVADTANFIVITPQAIYDALASANAWNSGASYAGYQLSQAVNDVGFLNALIDTVIAHYNIDQSRIYATGFSLGGFMCQRLACESTARFAAIASVSGTKGSALTCNPSSEIPICHFHGTADGTIAYTGNMYGNDPEALVNYWVTHNGCDPTPIHTALPDLAADGKTIDHYLYPNGNNNTDVEFYKVTNGAHEWLQTPTNDISYTPEIWKFFSKYQKTSASVNNIENNSNIELFPNPTQDYIILKSKNIIIEGVQIYNYSGQLVSGSLNNQNGKINVAQLKNGIYFLKITDSKHISTKKFVINR